ncbi:MAG: hypothetical protein Q8P67_13245 [archaeon]|nr:hypothetical protein [archaeon]
MTRPISCSSAPPSSAAFPFSAPPTPPKTPSGRNLRMAFSPSQTSLSRPGSPSVNGGHSHRPSSSTVSSDPQMLVSELMNQWEASSRNLKQHVQVCFSLSLSSFLFFSFLFFSFLFFSFLFDINFFGF